MISTNVTNLIKSLPKINLSEEIPYSILSPLYNRMCQKELAHSEILASFLNPFANHNHNFLFITQFLIDIGLGFEASKISDFNKIRIYTEKKVRATDEANLRPIDILITWEYDGVKNAIIIENKLNYAPDQPDQLSDYYKGIVKDYKVKKVVYLHINQHVKKDKGDADVCDKVADCLKNYNALELIKSLEVCNSEKKYSYITEYINLLKNNVQNYKFMESARKIQEQLIKTPSDFKKLIEVSKIVNSKEWHEAKFEIILNEFKIKFVNDIVEGSLKLGEVKKATEFNAYYKFLEFRDQDYWLDLWSFDDSVKFYLCRKLRDGEAIENLKVDEIVKIGNIQFEYQSNWGSWLYYNVKDGGNEVDFPSDFEDFKELISKISKEIINL